MHVAFVTQGRRVPASRFRVDQLVPELRKHIECTVLPAYPSVYGDSFVPHSLRLLTKPLSVVSRLRRLDTICAADVVWMQRPMTEYFWTGLERRVARVRPFVFDFDDAIFHNRWGLEARKIRAIIERAAHVVAGNRYLAEFVGDASKTTVIPTVVDATRYTPRAEPDGPFTIVWTGSAHNQRELVPYVDAFARVLRETHGRFVVISDRLDAALARIPVEFVPWSPESEVTGLADGHVGIMPLADTPYNRGKCAFKLVQYMARSIPVIASPVGANCDVVAEGVHGLFARSVDEWVEALLTLARDPVLRARMGAAGRQRVEDHLSVTAVVPQYLRVLEAVV